MQFQGQRNDQQNNAHLYKTSLCKNFVENGQCKYENNCRFAHGEGELRQSNMVSQGKQSQGKPYDRNNNSRGGFNNSRGGYNNRGGYQDRGGYQGNNQAGHMSNNFNYMQQAQNSSPQMFGNQPNPGQVHNQYDLSKVNTEEVDEFGNPTAMSNINMNMTNIYNMMTLNNKQGGAPGQGKPEFNKSPGMNQGPGNNYNNNQNSNYAYNPSNNNKFGNREQKPYGQNQYQNNKYPTGGNRNYNNDKGSMDNKFGYNKPRQFENRDNKFGGQDKGGQGLCKFFEQGSCKFGNNCKFSHGDNEMGTSNEPQQMNMHQGFNANVMKGMENQDSFPLVGEQKEQMYQQQQEFVHANINNEQQQPQEQDDQEFPMIGSDYNANNMQNSN